jgi:cytidylate kinase
MSRRFTLDEYLERFVDEQTEPGEEEITLRVTDAQVQSVGLFFIECMGGILQSLASEHGVSLSRAAKGEESDVVIDEVIDEVNRDEEDFIN